MVAAKPEDHAEKRPRSSHRTEWQHVSGKLKGYLYRLGLPRNAFGALACFRKYIRRQIIIHHYESQQVGRRSALQEQVTSDTSHIRLVDEEWK